MFTFNLGLFIHSCYGVDGRNSSYLLFTSISDNSTIRGRIKGKLQTRDPPSLLLNYPGR